MATVRLRVRLCLEAAPDHAPVLRRRIYRETEDKVCHAEDVINPPARKRCELSATPGIAIFGRTGVPKVPTVEQPLNGKTPSNERCEREDDSENGSR